MVSNGALLASGSLSNSAVTVVSGAAFGAATSAVVRVAALTLQEGAAAVWRYDGDARTAGRIDVSGTLTLPAAAELEVSGSGILRSGQTVFHAGALVGATDLSGWTLAGAPPGARMTAVGNDVVLWVIRGTRLQLK